MSSQIKKVLIIDDEGELNDIIALRLGKNGFHVQTATDGPTGLLKIAEFKPDAILLDINMPGMDGWEVCEKVKSNEETKHIKVVILTATRDFTHAKDRGADRVILKPFNYDEVLDVLRS